MPNPAERAIFLQAIEEENLSDRLAYLASACGADERLRASVDALLAAHDEPAELLDHPIGGDFSRPPLLASESASSQSHIGMEIGPYKLKEQIGEGGFGLVFVAEQEHPIRRRVALKIVKPGLGSKEVIARFEAERQAVAMMNHPNIAQVFDVGVTTDGRPYFVMELVRGLPIDEFCNKQQLNVNQRLELMVDVCSAVHHAHQKGIIHRDLKPSNVLVTLHDGKAVAKVIDFGIAKAMEEKLSDKSIYTRFLGMIGTPLYMSPEQAEMNDSDVDTRSDIYSLGVILYELLTGNTPFDRERLGSVGLDELRHIIRDEEPPLPSARLSTCKKTLSTISDQRRIAPQNLASALRGDLDWIVMKSLNKERSRRYDSAASLADDIRRYLAGEPIEARPPSSIYRLRKFAFRNRIAFVAVSLIGLTMILGTAVSLWQMSKAISERNAKDLALREATRARAEAIAAKRQVEQFAKDLVRANELVVSGQANGDAQRWADALLDFDAAVAIQPNYYLPRVQRAQLFTRLSLWPEAATDYAMALETGALVSSPPWWGVPALFLYTGQDEAFAQLLAQRRDEVLRNASIPQWMLLRDVAVGEPTSSVDYQKLLEIAHRWLASRPFRGPPRPPRFDPRQERPRRHAPGNPQHGPGPPRDRLGRPVQPDNTPLSLRYYVTAMLHLRAQEFEAAIDLLTNASRDSRWPDKFLIHAPMALAQHGKGNIARASEALDRSDKMIKEFLSLSAERQRPGRETPWIDSVEALLINREAWEMIRGLHPSLTSELDQRRAVSLDLLEGSQELDLN